ncbi:MAG: PhoH family protein [Alphaproteobacteria bacterium]
MSNRKTAAGRARRGSSEPQNARLLDFDDNRLLAELFGQQDRNLARIENELDVSLTPRGHRVLAEGTAEACEQAAAVLRNLYDRLKEGLPVRSGDVDGALRLVKAGAHSITAAPANLQIHTPKRIISPRSPGQARYLEALARHQLVFGLGPAGTGKTYLAVAYGVSLMAAGEVERLILSRPAVEAGERLGFLPGDMREKVDPYLRPLYDALFDTLPGDKVMRRLDSGDIEVAPLAFMRGRTLSNAFVILDEGQNATPVQMKMFLTRLGEHSRMVVTGDPSQIDLPPNQVSGLAQAQLILKRVEGVAFTRFTEKDVVRHPLVSRIVRAYNAFEAGPAETAPPAPGGKGAKTQAADD